MAGVVAVFVTWNPELDRLSAAVASVSCQVERVIIIDNGSRNFEALKSRFAPLDEVELLGQRDNLGIGAALNVGVDQALRSKPIWVLTMDQDTLVSSGAIYAIVEDFAMLDELVQSKCAIIALRPRPQPGSNWLTRYAESLLELEDRGDFTERRGVITSGNLVRADVVGRVPFNESMFIDQVDFEYCFELRRRGYVVLRQKVVTLDHVLGESYDDVQRDHPYENAQRLYYIVRNSTYMVLRRHLLVRHFVSQVVMFSGAFVSMNGARALGLGIRIIFLGMFDSCLGRMGRREYGFLSRGRR